LFYILGYELSFSYFSAIEITTLNLHDLKQIFFICSQFCGLETLEKLIWEVVTSNLASAIVIGDEDLYPRWLLY
jgi:hypothetical protein